MNRENGSLLRPITKMKIKKDKWLIEAVKYERYTVKQDIIEEMCHSTWSWINIQSDLEPISDYDTFRSEFIDMIYDKYIK